VEAEQILLSSRRLVKAHWLRKTQVFINAAIFMTTFGFIVATNNDEILQKNFLSSKVIRDNKYPVILQRGYRNIGKAYNDAMARMDAALLVCLHQDVFLPDEWEGQALASLQKLETSNWGVLGVAGMKLVKRQRILIGHVLDAGKELGSPEDLPAAVDTLDELLLIIRNDKKLLFDEQIPTAHFYGADICLQAASHGMDCFAIRAYCQHNAADINRYTPEFRLAAQYMQKKWRRRLPFATTCTTVEPKSVESLRRIIGSLGLQPLTRPLVGGFRRLRDSSLDRRQSQNGSKSDARVDKRRDP
jgi:hypothetical protein